MEISLYLEEINNTFIEGDPLLPPIPLVFTRTQSPFTVTLFTVSISEAIDPAGFNMSDFIISEGIDEATPGTEMLIQHACDVVMCTCCKKLLTSYPGSSIWSCLGDKYIRAYTFHVLQFTSDRATLV